MDTEEFRDLKTRLLLYSADAGKMDAFSKQSRYLMSRLEEEKASRDSEKRSLAEWQSVEIQKIGVIQKLWESRHSRQYR